IGGCSKSEIDDGSINSTNAVSFSTSTDKLTKGTVLDNTTAKNYDFGVYAYQTGTYSWSTATTKTEFMNDQLVEYSNDAWTYSPTKYWPASSDDKISFFGYMPMNDGTDTYVATTAATVNNYLPEITFEQVMEAAKMTDFVVGKALDQTKAASTVTIPFNHVLTRLNFSAKTETDLGSGSAVYISDLKILGDESDALYKSGTYTMSADEATNGAWSNPTKIDTNTDLNVTSILNKTDSGIGDPATTVTAVKISTTTQTVILADDEYLFLIPPYGTDGIKTENDIRLELTYEIITYDANSTNTNKLIRNEYTKELSLPVSSLVEGKAYNAVITIGLDDVVLSANLTDWEDEPSVNALPTEVTVSAATDVATNIENAFTNDFTEFTITYEGDDSKLAIDLSSITVDEDNKGMDLVINLPNVDDKVDITIPDGYEGGITIYAPNATVTANVTTASGTQYTDVTVTTKQETFIIPAGVVVNGLTILGGNVEVYGELSGDVVKGKSNTEETTTITFFYGSVKTDATIGDGITVIDDIDAADGLQVGAQDMKEGTTININ
ncbi:MAG: fimbrillin family protein, partial [Rikenellaceae bacterium]